jgi:predicted peroxiredoxin
MSGVNHALNIIILTDEPERFRGALTLGLAAQAMGDAVRMFLQLDAVRLLAPAVSARHDADHRAAGLPDLATLVQEALESGITLIACQSGLHLAGLTASQIDARIETGGPIHFLAGVGVTDRLITV